MQSDDEAPLTLSKWPFYLGDILLVVTALAIAILGEWQLTDMQVVSCVLAVALGAAIFVLPYIVEYSMRVREVSDDRESELRLLRGHLQKAEAALLQYHERLQKLESGSGSVDQRCELLASAVDQKLIAEAQRIFELSQQVEALNAKAQEPDAANESVVALQTELAALEARLTESVEPLSVIESRLSAVEESAPAPASEEERSTRSPRQRRMKSDSGLLHRAIQVKQDSASSAVSRIIDSKNKLVEPEKAQVSDAEPLPDPKSETEESVVEEPVVEEPIIDAEPVVAAAPELVVELDPEEPAESLDGLPENIEVSLGADLIEDDELLEAEARAESEKSESKSESSVEPKPEVEAETPTETEAKASKPAPEAKAEAKDLFGEAEPATTRRARTKANDAVFTVSILIGIGNKPFLRGSGGGLSWESGLPMDFEEIGKWRWVAPVDMEEPVELQVYRNDEDPDRKGRYTLEPGQKLEVFPVF